MRGIKISQQDFALKTQGGGGGGGGVGGECICRTLRYVQYKHCMCIQIHDRCTRGCLLCGCPLILHCVCCLHLDEIKGKDGMPEMSLLRPVCLSHTQSWLYMNHKREKFSNIKAWLSFALLGSESATHHTQVWIT